MYNISRRSGFLKKRYFSLIGIITLTLVASNYNDTLAAELPIESQNNIVENSRDEVKKQQITISTDLIQGIMNGENLDSSEFKNQIDIGYEFTNSNSLNAINADEAYYHGYTGKGVTVGVIEAGYADKRNVDLDNNRIKYNMNADENITHVLHPHATFIVGIIGAEKNGDNNTINKMGSQKNMHGVAYNSTVYSYAVGEKGTVGTTNDDEDVPYHIAEQSKDINFSSDIKVVNESISTSNSTEQQYLKAINDKLLLNDTVIVEAMGNNAEVNPATSKFPLNYKLVDNDKYKNNYILVVNGYTPEIINGKGTGVNTKPSNGVAEIAVDSNLAGNNANITVTAPGEHIFSTVSNDNVWNYKRGTSFSAPLVAGSVALVAEALPYFNGKQLADTILSTANNDFKMEKYYFQYGDGALNIIDQILKKPNLNIIFTEDYTDDELIDVKNEYYNKFKKDLKKDFNIDSYNEFSSKVKVYKLTKEQIFGQGFLDVGKAVQGPGYLDANRIGDEDKRRQGSKDLYYYMVDTGNKNDNYEKRSYSIWSNDIGEKRRDDDLSVGLLKTGEVDLFLLGDNTFTGEAVAYDGNVHIIKGVGGDVSARSNGILTLNGKAKNVYAIDGGVINISDRIDKSAMDATLSSFLPDSNIVQIEGTVLASGDNSKVHIDLHEPESVVKGPVIQSSNGELDISLSGGAQFVLQNEAMRYDGNSFTTNNIISQLSLNNNGTFDTTQEVNRHNITINKLSGNNGIFKVKTDLLNNSGDKITIVNAEGDQNHSIGVVDKNGYPKSNDVNSVLVAEAPNSINFTGLTESNVNGKDYTPAIDYLIDDDRKNWYFYGYEEQLASDSSIIINTPITVSGVYTTNHILNRGIDTDGATIKVNKTTLPCLVINKTNGEYPRVGVLGSTRFIGNGPIEVNVSNDKYRASGTKTIGIGGNNENKYHFLVEQPVTINILNKNEYALGINNRNADDVDGLINNYMLFNDDLNINYLSDDNISYSYGKCIDNNGSIDVTKNLNINIQGNHQERTYAINNDGDISIGGDLNIIAKGKWGGTIIGNTGNMVVSGTTKIKAEIDKDTSIYANNVSLLENSAGVIDFNDSVTFDMNGNWSEYNNVIGMRIGGDNNAKLNVKGDLDIIVDNFNPRGSFYSIYVERNGELNVDGTLSISEPLVTDKSGSRLCNAYVGGTINSNNLVTNSSIVNSGSMNVNNDFSAYEYHGHGDLTVNGVSMVDGFSNYGGDVNCNELYVKDWKGDNSYSRGNIKKLKIDNAILYAGEINGKYSIENLEVLGNLEGTQNYELLRFENENYINKDGIGTVKINRNTSLKSGILRLSNKESYLNGTFNGGEKANLIIENGAKWIVPNMYSSYYPYDRNNGNTTINNGGKIIVPVGKYISLNTLSGTAGIFEFDIEQENNNSGNISAGMVSIDKNLTTDAIHTINLNPVQADFVLTNDVTVKPFDLIRDSSTINGGANLNFDISNFDAGVYNYTPKLVKVNDSNVNVWRIVDIKVTGSEVKPSDNDYPEDKQSSGDNGTNTGPVVNPKPSEGDKNEPKSNTGSNLSPDKQTGDTSGSNTTKPVGNTGESTGTINNGKDTTNNTGNKTEWDVEEKTDSPNDNTKNNSASDTNNSTTNYTDKLVLSNLTYNVEAAAINNYNRWRNEYNNLTKRLGDLRSANEDDGVWFRTFNGRQESSLYGMDSKYTGIQLGYDKCIPTSHDGKIFLGGAVTHYQGNSSFKHNGYSENRSNGLALYASWLGSKGHYADLILRHSRMKTDLKSYAAGTGTSVTGTYHDWGTSLSFEYGRKIDLPHNYYLQPEVELIYGHVGSSDYELNDSTRVHQNSINSLTARAGIKIGRQVKDNNFYASINYLHDFGGSSSYSIADKYGASYSHSNDLNDSWWEVNVGANLKINNNTYCYAELEKTFGGNVKTKLQGNIGMRWSF